MTVADCPRCKLPMALVELSHLHADACRRCEGLWFDRGELSQALELPPEKRAAELEKAWTGKVRDEKPGASDLVCPRCAAAMVRYKFAVSSPVVVDGCTKGCGLWLDDGELGAIAMYLSDHMKPATPAEVLLLKEHQAKFQRAVESREKLRVENLTTLDEKGGVTGALGHLLQAVYGAFYKLGLR